MSDSFHTPDVLVARLATLCGLDVVLIPAPDGARVVTYPGEPSAPLASDVRAILDAALDLDPDLAADWDTALAVGAAPCRGVECCRAPWWAP